MKGILKWPLIIAAFLVVVRVILERAGAPETVNNIFSVVVFYVLIAPLYFASQIAKSGIAAPYKTLLKTTAHRGRRTRFHPLIAVKRKSAPKASGPVTAQ